MARQNIYSTGDWRDLGGIDERLRRYASSDGARASAFVDLRARPRCRIRRHLHSRGGQRRADVVECGGDRDQADRYRYLDREYLPARTCVVRIAAEMVQDAAQGRFILGLGVSHRPALEARGIEMGNARDRLRHDTDIIRKAFNGELSMFGTKIPEPAHPIPIYFAALALETSKLAGEMADGLMLYMCPPERMRKSIEAANKVAKEKGRAPGSLTMTCGVPLFLHDDLKTAYEAARRGLAFYGALPFYNRIMANSGFADAAGRIMEASKRRDSNAMAAAVTNELADAVARSDPPRDVSNGSPRIRDRRRRLILAANAVDEDYPSAVRRVHKTFEN